MPDPLDYEDIFRFFLLLNLVSKKKLLPSKMPNEMIKCSTDVAKIVIILPIMKRTLPKIPIFRIGNFLNKLLANKPAKLYAQK